MERSVKGWRKCRLCTNCMRGSGRTGRTTTGRLLNSWKPRCAVGLVCTFHIQYSIPLIQKSNNRRVLHRQMVLCLDTLLPHWCYVCDQPIAVLVYRRIQAVFTILSLHALVYSGPLFLQPHYAPHKMCRINQVLGKPGVG